jgi:hypothetical protein
MPSFRRLRELMGEALAADQARRALMRELSARSQEQGPMNAELAAAIERWKAWFGRRDEVAARVLPGVTRWEWSTGRRHSSLPLRFERYPGRGRLLKEPPTSKAQHTQSGLSGDGRQLVSYTFDYQEQAFETYVLEDRSVTDSVEFSPGPRIPLEHARIEWDGDRVVRHTSFRLNGYTPKMGSMGRSPARLVEWLGPNGRFFVDEHYRYDGPLLREVEVYGEMPGLGPHRYVDRVSHGDEGSLVAIDRIWEHAPAQVVYRRRHPGVSLEALRTAAVAELTSAVVELVGLAAAGERVYCLELSYDGGQQFFPPLITLGFERDRASLSEPDVAFRPMLGRGLTVELPEPDALEACRQLDQEARSRQRGAVGVRMLREAAAKLTRHDWVGVLEVTDDFVAFAIDPEFDDLEDALAASVGRDQIAPWKAAGWL